MGGKIWVDMNNKRLKKYKVILILIESILFAFVIICSYDKISRNISDKVVPTLVMIMFINLVIVIFFAKND